MEVQEISRADELEALREPWDRLFAQTAGASIFQSHAWLTAYWRHYGGDQRLRLLLVRREGQPLGLLPLTVRRQPSPLGALRVLGYPLDNWGTIFAPLGPRPAATLEAALGYVRSMPRDWDLLDLRWIAAAHADAAANACRQAGLPVSRRRWGEVSRVDFRGSWETYWMARSSKLRNSVRRSEKRLAALGRVDCLHCRPGGDDPRWDVYDRCAEVAAASWQASTSDGNTISHASVRGFLREVHEAAARRGQVAMHLLTLDETPVAFTYNYVVQGRAFGLRAGFDPRWTDAGPGVALLARTIRDGFENGERSLDMGETAAAYKRQWRTAAAPTYRLCHYPRTNWRAQAVRLKNRVADFANAVAT